MKLFRKLMLAFGLVASTIVTPVVVGGGVAVTSIVVSAEPAQAEVCGMSQSGCTEYRCSNGIIVRGVGAITASAIANACDRGLGQAGAPASVPDGCITMEVGRVPQGTKKLVVAVHNPGTFRNDCGVQFCQDCLPYHSQHGYADLAAELTIVDGKVKVPTSWFIGRDAFAWLCIPGTHLSVGLQRGDLQYLVQHRRTPAGDPLKWAKSRYAGEAPAL